MKIMLSVPTGYHAREILLPLKQHLEHDTTVTQVLVVTPAAKYREEVFPAYTEKFQFIAPSATEEDLRHLMATLAPSIVVTPTAGLDEADVPLLRAAKQAGIPTLTFIASWDNVYKMARFRRFGKPYELADALVVWNATMAEHLQKVFPELLSDRIAVIGAPRLDFFVDQERIPAKTDLLRYLDIPDDGGKLVHIATTELYDLGYVLREIHRAKQDGRIAHNMHLYASVHPGGDIHRHKRYAAQYGVTVRYSFGRREQAPLPEFQYNPTLEETYMLVALFTHADVLINHSSTVAIESLLADVPVINVKYGARFDWWRWRRSMVYRDFKEHYREITAGGGTSVVTSPAELIRELKAYLEDPNRKAAERHATIKKMITNTSGTAGQMLLDKIKKMAH